MSSFYTEQELAKIGLKKFGANVLISKKASIYNANQIEIGSNVRIDDFCLLSGNIKIGSNVHIAAYTALYGGGKIIISDYCGCSARCTLISSSDDFSGEHMVGAVIPDEFKNVNNGTIVLENYTQLGANTVVLPDVCINEGAVTGSMSLVNRNLEPWSINVGVPCKKIKDRKKDLLELVKKYERK